MNAQDIQRWEQWITQAAALGVQSWTVLQAALQDAGADDATIAALAPKWDALVDDVRRAAGEPPPVNPS